MGTAIGLKTVELKAVVNRDLSLAEMISAGKYDWVNDDITAERFPIKGGMVAETSFELVHLDRNIESDEAVEELAMHGLRPADLAELIAFGAAFPEEQRQYPIVGLGSVAGLGSDRCVVYLDGNDSELNLFLSRWDVIWDAGYRFLAVRK